MAYVGQGKGLDNWRRSSYSSAEGQCLEVKDLGGLVSVRDSKHPAGAIRLTRAAWRAFVNAVKSGQLNRQTEEGHSGA